MKNPLGKAIIDDSTLLTWLVWSVAVAIPAMLLAAVLVFVLYGCWSLSRAGNDCLRQVPLWLTLSPLAFSVITGAALTWRSTTSKGSG